MKAKYLYGIAKDQYVSRLTFVTKYLGAGGEWYIATNNTYSTKTEALSVSKNYPGSYVVKSKR